jgi:hypothetical protein
LTSTTECQAVLLLAVAGEGACGSTTSISGHFSGSCGCRAREHGKGKEREKGGREEQAAAACRAALPFTIAGHGKTESAAAAQRCMREARGGEGRNDLGFPGEHPAAGGFVSVKCMAAVGLPICATDGCERPGVDGPVSAQVGAEHGPLWWPTHWLLGCEPKRT